MAMQAQLSLAQRTGYALAQALRHDSRVEPLHANGRIRRVSDLLIDGNEVRDCVLGWSESVVVNGNVEDFVITNNVVHDNNNIGIDAIGFEGECMGCSDALDRARDGLIAGNHVYNIDSAGNPAARAIFAQADGIMGEYEQAAYLHQGGHAQRISRIFREHEEGGAVRDDSAM